jgi:iron(III) transport system permease protein
MKKFYKLFFLIPLFFICVYPFFYLTQNLLINEKSFDFSLFKNIFSHPLTLTSIRNSLLICSLTVLLSCLIAIPVAWLLTRSSLNFKKQWRTIFSLPYAIPPFIGAIAWIQLANPSNGLLKTILPHVNVYSSFGLIFVMSSFFLYLYFIKLIKHLRKN